MGSIPYYMPPLHPTWNLNIMCIWMPAFGFHVVPKGAIQKLTNCWARYRRSSLWCKRPRRQTRRMLHRHICLRLWPTDPNRRNLWVFSIKSLWTPVFHCKTNIILINMSWQNAPCLDQHGQNVTKPIACNENSRKILMLPESFDRSHPRIVWMKRNSCRNT